MTALHWHSFLKSREEKKHGYAVGKQFPRGALIALSFLQTHTRMETSGEQDFPSTGTDSSAAVTPLGRHLTPARAPELLSGHQWCELDIQGALRELPLKEESNVFNCPLSAVPHVPQGSRIPEGSTAPDATELVLHNHSGVFWSLPCQLTTQLSEFLESH